jgi:hypothetical protein
LGLSPRPCQVSNKLASAIRVLVPSGLREPPLILRILTRGRMHGRAQVSDKKAMRLAR